MQKGFDEVHRRLLVETRKVLSITRRMRRLCRKEFGAGEHILAEKSKLVSHIEGLRDCSYFLIGCHCHCDEICSLYRLRFIGKFVCKQGEIKVVERNICFMKLIG